jgi:hypothetical protein
MVDGSGLIRQCYLTYIGSLTLPIFISYLSFKDNDSTTVSLTLIKLCRILKKSGAYRYDSEIRQFVKLLNYYCKKGHHWSALENRVYDKYLEFKIQNIVLFKIKPIYYKHGKRVYRTHKHIKHGINVNKLIKGV